MVFTMNKVIFKLYGRLISTLYIIMKKLHAGHAPGYINALLMFQALCCTDHYDTEARGNEDLRPQDVKKTHEKSRY